MPAPQRLRLSLVLVPLLGWLGARFSLAHTALPEGVPIFWLPNAIILSALLLLEGRGLFRLLLAGFAAELLAGRPGFSLAQAALLGLINAAEIGLIFWLLRRWRFSPLLATVADLSKFVVVGPGAVSFLAALLSALAYTVLRGAETNYLTLLRIVWFSDGVALIILTPLLLSLQPRPPAPRLAGTPTRKADLLTAIGGAAIIGLFLAAGSGSTGGLIVAPGLLLPFFLYVAARTDVRWTAIVINVMALLMTVVLARGQPLFGDVSASRAVIELQRFIFVLAIMGLGLAALLGQLRARQAELAASNERLNRLNHDLEAHVAQRTAELRALNATLLEMAQTDSLTGLLNRRAFLSVAAREVERARRHGRPLMLMMIDLDYFKQINDQHGHQAGDLVLERTAALLAGTVRATDTLARYGGEEFVLLAPETDQTSAVALANRLRQVLREQTIVLEGGGAVQVTASFGLALYRPEHDDLDGWLRRADGALYTAKHAGRDRLVVLEATQAPHSLK